MHKVVATTSFFLLLLLVLRRSEIPPHVCRRVSRGAYTPRELRNAIDTRLCRHLIWAATEHAQKRGWGKKRHANYPTTDIDTRAIPNAWIPVQNIVYRDIIPRITEEFGLHPLKLGISEVFIAKYNAAPGQQRKLNIHKDGSDFSFVVALNDSYTGGGTGFYNSKKKHIATFQPKQGDAVIFCGQTKHAGLEVTSGTRYIMTGFLYYHNARHGCNV